MTWGGAEGTKECFGCRVQTEIQCLTKRRVLDRATLKHILSCQDSELSIEKGVLVRTHGVTETPVTSLGKKGAFSDL